MRALHTLFTNPCLDRIKYHRDEWQVGQALHRSFPFGSLTDDLGPQEASVGQIVQFQHLFLSPLFVVYASLLILASMTIMFYFAPKSIFTRLSCSSLC